MRLFIITILFAQFSSTNFVETQCCVAVTKFRLPVTN